jgi:hypothetical protein
MRRLVLASWIGLAGLILFAVPASAADPIEGRWSMEGGIVELLPSGEGFESHWVTQRPGILCPAIDDQDGDLRVTGKLDSYSGTWNWVLRRGGVCKSLGPGPVTITVAADGLTARLESNAPPGYSANEAHTLTRLPDGRFSELQELSAGELATMPDLVEPLALAASLDEIQLAAVPRLEQLPFQGRAPFVK